MGRVTPRVSFLQWVWAILLVSFLLFGIPIAVGIDLLLGGP